MSLSLESRFLLDTLRASTGDSAVQPQLEQAEQLNPRRLLSAAQFHGVSPLVYKAITTLDSKCVPSQISDLFRQDVRHITLRLMQMTRELLDLLGLLEKEKIPTIAFKGPTLSIQAYGSPFMRQSGDLDLLVREEDLARACSILASQGYKDTSEVAHARNLLHPTRGVAVDLHRWVSGPVGFAESAEPLDIDSGSLFERSDHFIYQERRIRAFRIEDLLLVLCIHAAKHAWEKWIWLFDIQALITRHPELDWDQLSRRAHELRIAQPVYLSLRLTETICGSHLPPSALRALNPRPEIERLIRPLHSDIVQDPSFLRSRMRTEFLPFQTLATIREKTAYGVWLLKRRMAPNRADLSSLRLPPYLHFLYVLTRPLRLMFNYGKEATGYIAFRLFSIRKSR